MQNRYGQLLLSLFKTHTFEPLFGESKFVCFAESKDTESQREQTQKPEEPEDLEKPEEKEEEKEKEEELEPELKSILTQASEKYYSILDRFEYKMPADIDPKRVKDAREIVDEKTANLDELNNEFNSRVSDFLEELGVNVSEQNFDDIWRTILNVVPEYSRSKLKEYKKFEPELAGYDLPTKTSEKLKEVWKKYAKDKSFNLEFVNNHAQKLSEILDKIAEQEFEMLKTINEVKEVMWDMHDTRKKRHIEQRLLKGAIVYTGLPLEKDKEFAGIRKKITGWNENHEPQVEEYTDDWILKDVYVDKRRSIDPEDPKKKQDLMVMRGVWVAMENKKTGRVYRMGMNRFKEFANMHQLKPKLNKKSQLYEHVPHIKEMNFDIKPGTELEYDEWIFDEGEQRYVPKPGKIKVKYIDDKVVKFDREVLIYSPFDNPDPKYHVKKDQIDLGEFATWLNRTLAAPTMNVNELQDKLHEHYDLMNKQFKRNDKCHDPILLNKDEIIFADAPGNPLYQILNDPGNEGVVKLSRGREFTFPQFLKWVYENGMEPYKPELEANKVKYYMKGSNREAEKTEKLAQRAEEHFTKEGIWRDTLKKLKEAGNKGVITGPEIKIKKDERNIPMKDSHSYLRQFARDTYLLDLDSIWQLLKSGREYYSRNWRRRQKARYSAIGKGIPWFGTEFERINQQSENEEVDQFKQAMDMWGVPYIQECLYTTGNKDQAKACFNVLAEKGQIRWDDRRLWIAINKFTDINHKIPMPESGIDPYIPFREGSGKTFKGMDVAGRSPLDFLSESIDSIWGESTYISWKRQNDGALEDGVTKSYNRAKALESDPNNNGGIARELELLLERHLRGEYVDPSEFEGMLRFIVEAGKAGGKEKMFYLLMGTSAKYPPNNPEGRTILGWDRVGTFITNFSNQFPALDFFSASNTDPKRDTETGEIFTRPWIKSDFDWLVKPWVDRFTSTGDASAPGDAESYLWKEVLTSDAFQKRLEKGIRNANEIDHDDSPYFIPALKQSEIESACGSSGGETKKFTIQGYKNAYVGFGMRLRSLHDKYEEEMEYKKNGQVAFENQYLQKLITTFQSFMKYDGILDNRYNRRSGSRLQRFSSHDYRTGCIWDANRALYIYQKEMQDLIKEIAKAYGEDENSELVEKPFKRLPSIKGKKALEKEQTEIEHAIENFGTEFENMLMRDGGKKMVDILDKHKFKAEELEDLKDEDKIKNKMNMEVFEAARTRSAEEE